jgi:NADP-dependent 3-hydroxy acid dehydrogenase YdfG
MDLAGLIDDALEVTVVGSFSRIGYAVRERLFDWTTPPERSLAGQTVLVTGPTSGIGRAATDALAAVGARIVLLGRSPRRLAAVRDELVAAHGEDRFPTVVADMGSLASVHDAVARITESEPRMDVVVDNAGAINQERI